jgi:hypothetical protein
VLVPIPPNATSCPKDTNYDKIICEYDNVQHEIDNLFDTEMAADEVDESKKSVYVFYASQKQCMPQVESVSFLGYCIPKLNEVILRTANSTLTDTSDSSSEVAIMESTRLPPASYPSRYHLHCRCHSYHLY